MSADPSGDETASSRSEALLFRAQFEAAGMGYMRFLAFATALVCLMLIGFVLVLQRSIEIGATTPILLGVALWAAVWVVIARTSWPMNHYRLASSLLLVSHFGLASALIVLDPFGYGGGVSFVAILVLTISFFAFGITGLPPGLVVGILLAGAALLLGSHQMWVSHQQLNLGDETLIVTIVALVGMGGFIRLRAMETRERRLFQAARSLAAAQEKSEELARLAQHESAERARFLAAVSHDVRQPLTAMNLRLSLLRERVGAGDGATRKHFEELAAGIVTLGHTLSATLGLSQLQSRGENWPVDPVNAAEILTHVDSIFRPLALESGVHLSVRLPADPDGCWVNTHRDQFGMVVTNLVANALKFQRPASVEPRLRERFVLIAAVRRGERLCINVVDNGVGIAAENRERIFEPYFQAANPERNRARGVGLGLANVRAALRWLPQHELHLDSRPGKGSCFRLELPRVQAPWFVRRKEALLPTVVRLEGAYVLVIDDEELVRDGLVARLQAWGAYVVGAGGLAEMETLCGATDRCPDLLISDFQLPGIDNGIDALNRLRAIYGAQVPAILISGRDRIPVDASGAALPPDTVFLPKPLDSDVLGHEISGLLAAPVE